MRTETAVRDAATCDAQRQAARQHENELMTATAMGAQALAYGALYVLPAAANAAWIAILTLLLPLAALRLLGLLVRRTAPENAPSTLPYRLAAGGMALLFFSNMAVCLLTLTELAGVFFFPGSSRLPLALAAAAALGLGLPRSDTAAPNTARFLHWFLAAAFVFCAATVLPTGEAGYLYPLPGFGLAHTLRCGLTASGSVWMVGALHLLSPREKPLHPLRSAAPHAVAVALTAAFFLCCAYVLPGTELTARRGYALRLQLLMEMSPSTLSWSLMLMAEMLLFLAGFALCADLMRKSLRQALGVKSAPVLPFALLCVPLACQGMGQTEQLLIRLLPWRYPLMAGLMALCLGSNLVTKWRKNRP